MGYQTTLLAGYNNDPTNVVWFREPVPLLDLKRIALSLIRAGVELRAIKPLFTPGRNAAFIGFDLEFSTHPLWMAAEIMATKDFRQPRSGINQAYVAISSPTLAQRQEAEQILRGRGIYHTWTLNPTGAVKTIATGIMSAASARQLAQEMLDKGINCQVRYP